MSIYAFKTMTPELVRILQELHLLELAPDADEHAASLARLESGYLDVLEALRTLPVGNSMRSRIAAVMTDYKADVERRGGAS